MTNDNNDNVELITQSGKVFEHAGDVIKLLKYFQESQPLDKALEEIFQDYPSENREAITQTIQVLINERMIINQHYDTK